MLAMLENSTVIFVLFWKHILGLFVLGVDYLNETYRSSNISHVVNHPKPKIIYKCMLGFYTDIVFQIQTVTTSI